MEVVELVLVVVEVLESVVVVVVLEGSEVVVAVPGATLVILLKLYPKPCFVSMINM
jgi:hypothetical protein